MLGQYYIPFPTAMYAVIGTVEEVLSFILFSLAFFERV